VPYLPWLALVETASKAIPALQVLTVDGSQLSLNGVLAAGAIAKIDPNQDRSVIGDLINSWNGDDAPP
jgi:hypothetical protein